MWLYPGRVVQVIFTGEVTVEEMEECAHELVIQYLDVGKAPVHVIANIQKMVRFPTSMIQLNRINHSWMRHPSLGWAIAIGNDNILFNFVVSVGMQVIGGKYRIVGTAEEAISTLKKIDPSLGHLTL